MLVACPTRYNLSQKFSSLLEFIVNIKKMLSLDLSGNKLTALPDQIGRLRELVCFPYDKMRNVTQQAVA